MTSAVTMILLKKQWISCTKNLLHLQLKWIPKLLSLMQIKYFLWKTSKSIEKVKMRRKKIINTSHCIILKVMEVIFHNLKKDQKTTIIVISVVKMKKKMIMMMIVRELIIIVMKMEMMIVSTKKKITINENFWRRIHCSFFFLTFP